MLRIDIYYCPCCNSLRDTDHKKVSNKYCMRCGEIGKQKAKKIFIGEAYGQFCPTCYVEVKKSL